MRVPEKPGRGWVITPCAGRDTYTGTHAKTRHTQTQTHRDTPSHIHRQIHRYTQTPCTCMQTQYTDMHTHAHVCTHRHTHLLPSGLPGSIASSCPRASAPWWSVPALPWHTPVSAYSPRSSPPRAPGTGRHTKGSSEQTMIGLLLCAQPWGEPHQHQGSVFKVLGAVEPFVQREPGSEAQERTQV